MDLLHRDLALVFNGKGRVLGEFLIKISEDRPGILAALSNVFADNGINILNISVNVRQLLLHFVVDLTNMDSSLNDLEKEFKNFSFVQWIRYRVVEGMDYMLPTMIIPTFGDKHIFVIEVDKVPEGAEVLSNLARKIGLSDGKALANSPRENLGELVRLGQFRGLGKVTMLEQADELAIRVCNASGQWDVFAELVKSYYVGLMEGLLGDRLGDPEVSREGDCLLLRFKLP